MSARRIRGIEQGQHVTLLIADLGPVGARIESISDDHAIVGLFKDPEPSLEQIGEVEGVIEATTARGLVRIVGTLRGHGGQTDACRLVFDQGPEVIQRRQFVRIETTTDVVVTREDGTRHKSFTLNLSGAGLLITGPPDLQMEEPVVVDIVVGQEQPSIHARGRVVRETRDGHKGVRIEMIEEGDRERLIHFVFERQRAIPRVRVR
ncbi:MAG: hypothetical protein QOJ07_3258 [Thermoleophilaceae bacterium]|nr:hypothetical protein [Thermoleophilaceae bacterium]